MKLLIFGASGATGKHLVSQALEGGFEVSAFVRDLRKLPQTHPRLTLIQGNVEDVDRIHQAIAGHDAVLSALGANGMFQFDPVVVNGLQHIVQAMATQRVKRLIYLSTLGVRDSRKRAGFMIRVMAPTLLRHEIRGHELREEIIQHSSLHWTIVRAPILTNTEPTGNYRIELDLQSRQIANRLSRADVAYCMLEQLKHDQFINKAVSVMA